MQPAARVCPCQFSLPCHNFSGTPVQTEFMTQFWGNQKSAIAVVLESLGERSRQIILSHVTWSCTCSIHREKSENKSTLRSQLIFLHQAHFQPQSSSRPISEGRETAPPTRVWSFEPFWKVVKTTPYDSP